MPELVLRLVQLGFLTLLWLFVLVAVRAVRADLFGAKSRPSARPVSVAAARAEPARRERAARVKDKPKDKSQKGKPRRLVVTEGSLRGTVVELSGGAVTIGRAEGVTLVLADDYASNRHAKLSPDGHGGWLVEDLGSTNGTFLDRTKVTEPMPVAPGVPIRIGRTVLELRT